MNAIATPDDSTDSATIYVAAEGLTGAVGRGSHILDVEAVADAVETAVGSVSEMLGDARVQKIIVRSSYPVEQELEDRTEDLEAAPDVEFFELSWMLFLDDDGVKRPSDDPVADIMADEGVIDSPDDLNLSDYEDRQEKVDTEFLDEDRIAEAKERAKAVTDNIVFNDEKEYPLPEGESADATVILHDGNVGGVRPNSKPGDVLQRAHGYNNYVEAANECGGPVLPINVSNEFLDWEFHLLREGAIDTESLSDTQREKLMAHHDREELKQVGLEFESESETDGETETSSVPDLDEMAEVRPTGSD